MNIDELKGLLLTIENSHSDYKITDIENPIIQSIYIRFQRRCLDLKIAVDIKDFYNILIDIEEELKRRISKINYETMKKRKSY